MAQVLRSVFATAPRVRRGLCWGGSMLVRVVQFLLGATLAAGGGYLAWDQRALLASAFPPGPSGAPWLLLAGVFGLCAGAVFLVSAVHHRPNRRKAAAARAEQEGKLLSEADAYYAEASRAADRDWRSGDLPAPVKQAATPPATPAPAAPAAATLVPPTSEPARLDEPPGEAPPARAAAAPEAIPRSTAAAALTSAPSQSAGNAQAPPLFPAKQTLQPIPRAAEPPPQPPAAVVSPAPVLAPPPARQVQTDPLAVIASAIREGRLDEADQLLNTQREGAEGMILAQLTALAGDHAAAAGRQSHAKWLWRLALKRFGELNAIDTPAAQKVAENLRIAS